TEWDNAQALLVVGELKAIDWFIGASVKLAKPKSININPMTSGHYPKRLTTGRDLGRITSTHFLQTSVLSFYVMGASTSVAADATRAITKDTDEIPLWVGFHFEKEGTTTNQRKDVMGIVGKNLNISCSERDPITRQTYTGEFSFSTAAQASNLAQPTPLTQILHPPFTWYNYRNAAGTSSFLYNTGAINIDIIGLNINFGWTASTFGVYDANGYPNIGYHNPPFMTRVTIECKYKDAAGTDIQTISDLDHASYAGIGLILIANFYEDATNYMEFIFDDMFIDPDSFEEVWQSEGEWFDGFRFDLVFRNETSSLALSSRDNLGDTYYVNP
ncbi:MAG: hypothetical protein KAJ55_10285, partial [Anaerolineales bacterium]|nr:hypothetical protein [Anaerolineales bacterium]